MSTPRPVYVALASFDVRRDMRTLERYEALPAEPGPAHALDVRGTRDGDPWRTRGGKPMPSRQPHFYDGDGPHAACGERVRTVIPLAYDPEDPDACPECADLVRSGKAAWRDPAAWRPRACTAHFRSLEDGVLTLWECVLLARHPMPHKSRDGATWETGPGDFTPPPDGYV